MTNTPLPSTKSDPTADRIKVKVVGIGGAGSNVLDRLVLDDAVDVDLVSCNTDVQSLASSVATQKVQLGRTLTRGLGAGGDPEIGFAAAEEAAADISAATEGTPLVFIVAGLGGGTGSGAAPLVAKLARERGALVLACVTLPFSFEGRRRREQAAESLRAIQTYADAVICFENDRMGEIVLPTAGVHDAFGRTDQVLGQCVRSVIDLVQRRGLIRLGFDDLLTALRNHDSRCLFGYGEAAGQDRAALAVEEALRSPLMDGGSLLPRVAHVLVNITGGGDLTLAEIQGLMQALHHRIADNAQVLFGATVDARFNGRLGVTVIGSLPAGSFPREEPAPPAPAQAVAPVLPRSIPAAPARPAAIPALRVPERFSPPAPPTTRPEPARPLPARAPATPPEPPPAPEPVYRGRFERSEPTIVDGEDLDVPAFLRKGLKK
jgi:cell division protein FtsZ